MPHFGYFLLSCFVVEGEEGVEYIVFSGKSAGDGIREGHELGDFDGEGDFRAGFGDDLLDLRRFRSRGQCRGRGLCLRGV